MTDLSSQARAAAYEFEAKKHALRQTQDGGVSVTLNINPVDMPASLYQDAMGQRYAVVMVPIMDDETPRPTAIAAPVASSVTGAVEKPADVPAQKAERQPGPRRDWKELPYPQRAGIRCAEPAFHEFLAANYQHQWDEGAWHAGTHELAAAMALRAICGVSSRSLIKPGTEAAKIFDRMDDAYWLHTHGYGQQGERA